MIADSSYTRPNLSWREMPMAPSVPVGPPAYICDLCGSPMVEQNCKIRCLNCGYTRDCSDP